jgi:hypothetical protein
MKEKLKLEELKIESLITGSRIIGGENNPLTREFDYTEYTYMGCSCTGCGTPPYIDEA